MTNRLLKRRTALYTLLVALCLSIVGGKAHAATHSYGWDDWTNFKKPTSKRGNYPAFTGDERLYCYMLEKQYGFDKETVNGFKCLTMDFDEQNILTVKIPATLTGATLTIEGFAGIDDDYSNHKGSFKLFHKETLNEGANTPFLTYADNGNFTETGASYGVKTPFTVTANDIEGGWVSIIAYDMYIKSITVTYSDDFNGTVKADNEPVSGAEISFIGQNGKYHTVTDENGEFGLCNLLPGTYKTRISHTLEYADICEEITVGSSVINKEYNLQKRSGNDVVTTVDFENVKGSLAYPNNGINGLSMYSKESLALIYDTNATYRTYEFEEGIGKDGAYGVHAINYTSYAPTTLITHVRHTDGVGSFSFEAKRGLFIVNNVKKTAASVLQLYKMVRQEDGSFAEGELIADYSEPDVAFDETNCLVNGDIWTKIVLDNVGEEYFLGIKMRNIYVSDLVNIFPVDTQTYAVNATADLTQGYSTINFPRNPWNDFRDGAEIFWYNSNTDARAVGTYGGNAIDFGTTELGFYIQKVPASGKAKLTFVARPMDKSYKGSFDLSVSKFIKNEDGTYTNDYLVEKVVIDGVVLRTGENFADIEELDDMNRPMCTVTVDLPEAGYYGIHGYRALVSDIVYNYDSPSVALSGKVVDGQKAAVSANVTLTGIAGNHEATTSEDGSYKFENVVNGFYVLTADIGTRKLSREVYVENNTPDINVVFEEKPDGYTEIYDDFNYATKHLYFNKEELPINGSWYAIDNTAGLGIYPHTGHKTGGGLYFNYGEKERMAIRQVKGGEGAGLRFDVRCSQFNTPDSKYNDNHISQLSLYKVTRNEDGTFTKGDLIADIVKDQVILATNQAIPNDQTFITVDYPGITEDCWIGLYGTEISIDNFVNYYVEPKEVEVKFAVKDEAEAALPGAVVTLAYGQQSIELTVDEKGECATSFLAKDVEGQEWTATASLHGYENAEYKFTFGEENVEHTFTLTAVTRTFTAMIMDSEHTVIDDATLTVTDTEGNPVAVECKLAKWSFTLPLLSVEGKQYTAKVDAHGYTGETEYTFSLTEGDVNHDFLLEAVMRTYRAKVTDAEGNAIEASQVKVLTTDNDEVDLEAEGNGVYSFSLPLVVAEQLNFVASAKAHGYTDSDAKAFTLGEGNVEHTFALDAIMRTFTASVVDADNEAITDAEVTVTDADGNEVALTEADGSWSFTLPLLTVEGKTYKAVATAHGYDDSNELSFDLTEADVEHTFELEAIMRTYTAKVTDTEGNALEGGVVTVTDAEGNTLELTAEGAGAYSVTLPLLTVEGKTYTASAKAEGYDDSEAKTFSLDEGDVEQVFALNKTDGIYSIAADLSEQEVFTVNGLRVKAQKRSELTPGIYIINGKKVLVR